jgi:hypothetical protein
VTKDIKEDLLDMECMVHDCDADDSFNLKWVVVNQKLDFNFRT